MNRNNCWLCEKGTGLDNGGLQPGELHQDVFGDMICIYCQQRIDYMTELLVHPEIIPLVVGMQKLPHVEGWDVGIHKTESETA